MKTLSKRELQRILKAHSLWLASDRDKGERADLTNANLTNADLRYADLRYADLFNANLTNANLTDANLANADLINADLFSTNFTNAKLTGADLSYADLTNIIGKEIITFNGSRDFAYYCDGLVKIGCMCLPLSEWLENYKTIGIENNYSIEEIEEYGNWLKSLR